MNHYIVFLIILLTSVSYVESFDPFTIAAAKVKSKQSLVTKRCLLCRSKMEKSTSASRLYVTRDAPGDSYKSKSNKELSDAATNGVLFTPPFIDYTALTYIFATQTILVNAAIIPSIIAGMNLLENASFNVDSISLGVGFGLAMSIFGLGADQLNGDFFRKVSRDTKIYVLRLLGRSTKANVAFAVSAIISLNAGVAEELFFRGLIQQSIVNYTGDTLIALLSASALFGFAHYPIFGASALLEAFLGGIFGVVYNISGGNLIAPILAHFIYDFITLFFTWNNVSTDLQKTLKG